ncbi:MAG: hypothetical protein AAF358_19995 [Pseudomonadota bacterium]
MIRRTTLLTTAILASLWLTPVRAQDANAAQFVTLMNDYLSLADKVVDTAERREAAVFLAIEGIFEVYEQRRDAPSAVQHLNRILDSYENDRVVRNLVRFKLRDIFKETGDAEKALEQLDLIIAENARP